MVYHYNSFTPMVTGSFNRPQPNVGQYISYSLLPNNVSAPIFDGNTFRNPAPEFVEDFRTYLAVHGGNHIHNEEVKCSVFLACLTNDAKVWGKVFGRRHRSFASLEGAFLRRFWGPDVQWRVSDDFLYGSYRQKGVTSKMGKYFAGMLRRVSYLSLAPSEQQFIDTRAAHFPFHLQQQLKRLSSVEDAYLLLIQRDRTINYSAQLYKLRQQRQRELYEAAHAHPASFDDGNRGNSESECKEETTKNTTAKSTGSSEILPRSLGGGDVTTNISMTSKPSLTFNPGQRRLQNTLSDRNGMRLLEYDNRLDEPGSVDCRLVFNDIDIG